MRQEIQELCKKHGWQARSATSSPNIGSHSRVVVVLIPGWSRPDLQIAAKVAVKLEQQDVLVEVYDIDELRTQERIRDILPAAPEVFQTPVLAFFRNGAMEDFVQGEDVLEWTPPH